MIAIGGAGAAMSLSGDAKEAVLMSLQALAQGKTPLEAAVEGVAVLEDNPSFNAGRGSAVRRDGTSIQMDALVMDSEGRVGGVAGIMLVQHPVRVALDLAQAGHGVVGGPGALGFARDRGHGAFDPWTPRAQRAWELAMAEDRVEGGAKPGDETRSRSEGVPGATPTTPRNAVVLLRTREGRFAAAASDGGTSAGWAGGLGPVPIPGAAVFVGPEGATAASGPGNPMIQKALAHAMYERMLQADSPSKAVSWGLEQIPEGLPVVAAAVTPRTFHVGSRGPAAWASVPSVGKPQDGTAPP